MADVAGVLGISERTARRYYARWSAAHPPGTNPDHRAAATRRQGCRGGYAITGVRRKAHRHSMKHKGESWCGRRDLHC